jgi:hypothetical protein
VASQRLEQAVEARRKRELERVLEQQRRSVEAGQLRSTSAGTRTVTRTTEPFREKIA